MRRLLILLLFPVSVYSQQSACPCRFQGILSAGLAAGESAAKPVVQFSGGLTNKFFFAGAGVGLDPYRFHSIPVFADLRYNFGRMKTGFLYAHTGYNFTYNHKESEMWIWGNKTTDKSEGGFYLDAGIGYRLHLKGWHRLLFSAGFSHKRINNLIGYTYPCLFPPCPEDIYRNQYNLGRIIAKFSWEFTSPHTQVRP